MPPERRQVQRNDQAVFLGGYHLRDLADFENVTTGSFEGKTQRAEKRWR
jgi:hypothetical protein